MELVNVADLLRRAPEDTEPAIDGKGPARGWIRQAGGLREVELRAVLQRTCVLASLEEEHVRWLVLCAEVFVDERAIAWRPIRRPPGSWTAAASKRGRAHSPGRRQPDEETRRPQSRA